ncbi:PEP-CTERM sorting domain-containing protein [Methylobacillus pratensis]
MQANFKLKSYIIAAFVAFGTSALTAHADDPTGIQDAIPVSKTLAGNSKDNGWYNFGIGPQTVVVDGVTTSLPGNPGYPGATSSSAAWPNPITSQVNNGNAAYFNKVANNNGTGGLSKFNADGTRNSTTWGGSGFGPYPAGGSLYALSFSNNYNAKGGTLAVFDPTPVNNLANVVFQVEIGSANGYDFYQPSLAGTSTWGDAANRQIGALENIEYSPILNLTFADNTTASITANWAELTAQGYNGSIEMPTGPGGELVDEPIYINLYAFQWDLSSYSDITAFNITFDVVEHSQTYATRLTQSDVFNQVVAVAAVPEPETYAMLLAGLGLMGFVARRRKNA